MFPSHHSEVTARHRLSATENGFTLIEVMIALVILVIGVLGVLSMQLATIRANSSAMNISESVQELVAGVDQIESLDYSANNLNSGTGKAVSALFGTGAVATALTNNLDATITYDVADLNDTEIQTLFNLPAKFTGAKAKRVVVTATKLVSGKSKTIQMQYVKIDL